MGVEQPHRAFAQVERPTRAYVMLMIASRSPAKLTRKRTKRFEQAVESELARCRRECRARWPPRFACSCRRPGGT